MVITTEPEERRTWDIGLCEMGDFSQCAYAYCCICFAIGTARNKLDGSDARVSCLFLPPAALRWMTRTAYQLDGSAQEDCWYGGCCSCCVVNQVLQTVSKRGYPNVPEIGPLANVSPRLGFQNRSSGDRLYDAFYSCCCPFLATGLALESVGMPWWFGTCCAGPFAANSIMRYHHRIRPDFANEEFWADGFLPTSLLFIDALVLPGVGPVTNRAYAFASLAEANARMNRPAFYGCDLLGTLSCMYQYCCSGCSCPTSEGGYLRQSVSDPRPAVATYSVVMQGEDYHAL